MTPATTDLTVTVKIDPGLAGWLTVAEAAAQLDVIPERVRQLIRAKQIPAAKIGTAYVIRQEDVDARRQALGGRKGLGGRPKVAK